MSRRFVPVAAFALAGLLLADAPRHDPGPARLVFHTALPALDGAHLSVSVVEVHYAPGGASAAHRHPCAVVGYVIEGSLRSRVRGERETTYTAGQSFYEAPGAVHLVSANASRTAPVRFTATFTCDRDGPLSVPDTTAHTPEEQAP